MINSAFYPWRGGVTSKFSKLLLIFLKVKTYLYALMISISVCLFFCFHIFKNNNKLTTNHFPVTANFKCLWRRISWSKVRIPGYKCQGSCEKSHFPLRLLDSMTHSFIKSMNIYWLSIMVLRIKRKTNLILAFKQFTLK